LIAALVRARLVRHQGEGLPPAYLVPSPSLLEIALKLRGAGVDIETGAEAAALVRKRMRRAASDLVKHFARRTGKGFARSALPRDVGESLAALRSLGAEAVRLVFAEMARRWRHREGSLPVPPGREKFDRGFMIKREITLHGHRISYRSAGAGPLVVLIHGIAGSSETWDEIVPWLTEHHTVVAPDLLGHGASAKPRGDYSLGACASTIRDLLDALGHERGTIVGHSLGGGVAMQFAYQFPERTERMVLVSSGGLGREVHGILRAAALPGSEWVLPFLSTAGLKKTGDGFVRFLGRVGLRAGPDLEEIWRGFSSLADADARQAFIHTARTVLDAKGQRATAVDRLHLAAEMPTLIIWGEHDPLIPVAHARSAHQSIPGSRLEIFQDAGHFPHRDDPHRFVKVLLDFTQSTAPASIDPEAGRRLLLKGSATRSSPPPERADRALPGRARKARRR
jgi:pimeloyl-ACP methyl ester carboxylesterase